MFQILVVEDNKNARGLMEAVLKEYGYYPILTHDRLEALKLLDTHHMDLVILGIMMPDTDGYELTRQLKATDHTLPILMVTAKQPPKGKRKGFVVGTDDYITKPVDEEEMIPRIQVLLRRAQIVNERHITIGDTYLDYNSLTVSRGNESQALPRKEFHPPYKLPPHPDRVFTHIQLMDKIRGMEPQSDDNTTNVYIGRFQKRFGDYPEFTIETVRGLDYKTVKNP